MSILMEGSFNSSLISHRFTRMVLRTIVISKYFVVKFYILILNVVKSFVSAWKWNDYFFRDFLGNVLQLQNDRCTKKNKKKKNEVMAFDVSEQFPGALLSFFLMITCFWKLSRCNFPLFSKTQIRAWLKVLFYIIRRKQHPKISKVDALRSF